MLTDLSLSSELYTVSLLINVFLVGLLIWQAHFLKRKINHLDQRETKRQLKLQREIKTIARGAYGVGQRVIGLEASVRAIGDGELYKNTVHDGMSNEGQEQSNMAEAEMLFKQGVDAHSVAQRCGLSQSEASLMALIRGHAEEEEGA